MDTPLEDRLHIEQLIAMLERRIADCQRRFPAHSISPAMLAELDDLDEQLAQAQQRLRTLQAQASSSENTTKPDRQV